MRVAFPSACAAETNLASIPYGPSHQVNERLRRMQSVLRYLSPDLVTESNLAVSYCSYLIPRRIVPLFHPPGSSMGKVVIWHSIATD